MESHDPINVHKFQVKFHDQKWIWAEKLLSPLSAAPLLHPDTPPSVSARLSETRWSTRGQNIFPLAWMCPDTGAERRHTLTFTLKATLVHEYFGAGWALCLPGTSRTFGTLSTSAGISWVSRRSVHILHRVIFEVAQEQRELIYLRCDWRGQHFFHTSEKGLGLGKGDSLRLVFHGHMFLGVCVCVTLRQDLCEIVGGVVGNSLVGQLRQEAQHRLRVPGAQDLLRLTGEPRRTRPCGALEKHGILAQMKVCVGGPRAPE